jgi:hypothetical protein
MVQVDVLWSYALGAGFALAGTPPVGGAPRPIANPLADLDRDPGFQHTLLFLALVFVPSGAWLLWAFPSWETMHVGDADLPAWIVAAFSLTNVSQGALGYAIARALVRAGRRHAACLHFVGAYFGMFFILVHGWDGTGYRRFFSATPQELDGWTWSTAAAWLGSDVALTLYGMGVVMLPPMFAMMTGSIARRDPGVRRLALVGWILAAALLLPLGGAIAASLLVHRLGAWLGATCAAMLLVLVARPRGLAGKVLARMLPA